MLSRLSKQYIHRINHLQQQCSTQQCRTKMLMLPLAAGETRVEPADGENDVATGLGASAAEASKAVRSHSEAERRRRQRINGHLATLRSLLPAATRLDKAALLGEVVRQVRELKGRVDAADVAVIAPSEGDEVGVEEHDEVFDVDADGEVVEEEQQEQEEEREEGGKRKRRRRRVRAWVCCADRPGLMAELSRALRSVRARAVRVEMVTVGGRTRSLLELEMVEEAAAPSERGGNAGVALLQAALRAVLLSNRNGAAEGFRRARVYSSRLNRA